MKIGVIVYSQSGHTLRVARALETALSEAGHDVTLEPIEPVGLTKPGLTDIPLQATPELAGYDALVFGTPTWGGAMASPMATYLAQLDTLADKPVACLVTGIFPADWGRNQNLAQMKETLEGLDATVVGTGSVGWLSFRRKRQIAETVAQLSSFF
jgi:flavodoxin